MLFFSLFPSRLFWFSGAILLLLCFGLGKNILLTSLEERIVFFDVLGDATLLQSREGHNIVIDGGNNEIILQKLSNTLPLWNQNIDFLVVTHFDSDHLFGAFQILKHFSVHHVLVNKSTKNTDLFRNFLFTLQKKNTSFFLGEKHRDFSLGEIRLDTIVVEKIFSEQNNNSIVQRVSMGNTTLLLTGDIEKKAEKEFLKTTQKLTSTLIKVPHHGSKTSLSADFLSAVSPAEAVIIAHKNNPYGHPHQQKITQLQKAGILWKSTKTEGDIFLSPHNSFSLSSL